MNDKEKLFPKWIEKLFALIHKHWLYHAPCIHINITACYDQKIWHVKAAPVYQEVYGGDDDGKKVWAGFGFDLGSFGKESGVWLKKQFVYSFCQECSEYPKLIVLGKFQGHPISLEVYLEPVVETEPVEFIDTIQHEIRNIPKRDIE
jgi:hypothetical protein